ncbi:hypothetical protein Tco_0211075 [Tanacetum coccineum]
MSQAVPSHSTASAFYQNIARPNVSKAVLSQSIALGLISKRPVFSTSTGRPYYPRMDNVRPRASSSSPSIGFFNTRTVDRTKSPKPIIKSKWVKKECYCWGHQAVLFHRLMGQSREELKDMLFIDSGFFGSMTGDKDKLSDFKEYKRGYVAFGNDPKGGRITGKGTIKTSCIDFENASYVKELKFNLLSVSQIVTTKAIIAPRKNDVYSQNLKSIIPSGGVTCLVAKASEDEAILWHRKIGHARKSEEWMFVGLLYNNKGFRSLTIGLHEKVQDCLHVNFLEDQMNQKGQGTDWMFDLDILSPSLNYIPWITVYSSWFKLHWEQSCFRSHTNDAQNKDLMKRSGWDFFHGNSFDDENKDTEEEIDLDLNNMDNTIDQNRTNHKDQQTCLFSCFLSQEEPKKITQALQDESWVEAMQEELLQFKLQNGYRQEEGVDYDEVFAPVARIEGISRYFLPLLLLWDSLFIKVDVKNDNVVDLLTKGFDLARFNSFDSQYWNDEPIATFKGRTACKVWTLKEALMLFLRGGLDLKRCYLR